jgi:hypothetical protein
LKYQIVPEETWETARRTPSALEQEPHVKDLFAGKTIMVADEEFQRSGSLYRLARDNNKSLRVRSVAGGKLLRMIDRDVETQVGAPQE